MYSMFTLFYRWCRRVISSRRFFSLYTRHFKTRLMKVKPDSRMKKWQARLILTNHSGIYGLCPAQRRRCQIHSYLNEDLKGPAVCEFKQYLNIPFLTWKNYTYKFIFKLKLLLFFLTYYFIPTSVSIKYKRLFLCGGNVSRFLCFRILLFVYSRNFSNFFCDS